MAPDCNHGFPLFTPLGGMRMLAASLLEHYEIDSDEHPEVVSELADILGEEMLSVGREFLTERGLLDEMAMAR